MIKIMKTTRFIFVLLSVFSFLAANSADSDSNEGILVTPEWLSNRLTDSDLVLLHVGMPHDYKNNHRCFYGWLCFEHSATIPEWFWIY